MYNAEIYHARGVIVLHGFATEDKAVAGAIRYMDEMGVVGKARVEVVEAR